MVLHRIGVGANTCAGTPECYLLAEVGKAVMHLLQIYSQLRAFLPRSAVDDLEEVLLFRHNRQDCVNFQHHQLGQKPTLFESTTRVALG